MFGIFQWKLSVAINSLGVQFLWLLMFQCFYGENERFYALDSQNKDKNGNVSAAGTSSSSKT